MEPFIAQIMLFGGNFAPRGWAFCDGQLLAISEHQALFSLLGTTYGGDGRSTFALPDLRGCVPVHPGSGAGLSTRKLGQRGGQEQVRLSTNQLPSHTHAAETTIAGDVTVGVSRRPGTGNLPTNTVLAGSGDVNLYADSPSGTQALGGVRTNLTATTNTAPVGNGEAVDNMQPYVGINFIIALVGIFPSRN